MSNGVQIGKGPTTPGLPPVGQLVTMRSLLDRYEGESITSSTVSPYGHRMTSPSSDSDHVSRHLAHLRLLGRAENTIIRRAETLRRLGEWLGADPLTATPEQLANWRTSLEGLAPRTIRCYVVHVAQFYAWAELEELIPVSPARRLIKPAVSQGLPDPVDADVALAALDRADGRVRVWLALAGWCGLRAHSIARSRREDVAVSVGGLWRVSAYAAKGLHEYTVPLCALVVAELDRYGLPALGWNFTRLDGRAGHVSAARVSQTCNEWLEASGFDVRLHQFRHFFGTEIQRQTGDLQVTADLMGHSDIGTTRNYARLASDKAVRAVNLLPGGDLP
jgi:integrase